MNTLEKSVGLAKLMNLKVKVFDDSDWKHKRCYVGSGENTTYPTYYKPYSDCVEGLAQFAEILLKFPKAIMHYSYDRGKSKWLDAADGELFKGEPTQASILDVILRNVGAKE